MEKSLVFGSAVHMAGGGTTAGTRRMQESSAQVSGAHDLWSKLYKKGLRQKVAKFPEKHVQRELLQESRSHKCGSD